MHKVCNKILNKIKESNFIRLLVELLLFHVIFHDFNQRKLRAAPNLCTT